MTFNGPDRDAYPRRRRRLFDRMAGAKSVFFLPGVPEAIYSNDVHYRYRPATNIRYLTGFEEPAALLLSTAGCDGEFLLFVQPRDEASETWTGRRTGVEGAVSDYGADRAYPLSESHRYLEEQLEKAERFYYGLSADPIENEALLRMIHRVNAKRQRGGGRVLTAAEAGTLIDDMRLVKHDEEIELLRRACSISAEAHRSAMESVTPGMYEYEVEAAIEYHFRREGCAGPAYGTIAAAGSNATVLHYTHNTARLLDGQLLLVDAGGEYGGYCGDITRTMPIGSCYSKSQAELYDIVLAAQTAAVEAVKPGVPYDSVHDTAVRILVRGMLDVGILQGSEADCIESQAYKPYYMHGTSHWLGMDVHDVGGYRTDDAARSLEPGVVMTVEPGLYFRSDAQVPERFRGIGIRIEDDVLVSEEGREVLTSDAPKERTDVEALRRKAFS